jgi:hypothetical protein
LPGHADHGAIDIRFFLQGIETHAAADRVLTRPERVREPFADDRHRLRILAIEGGEVTPGQERNAHHIEVGLARRLRFDVRIPQCGIHRLSFGLDRVRRRDLESRKWWAIDEANAVHAGNGRNLLHRALVIAHHRVALIPLPAERDAEGRQRRGAEPLLLRLQLAKAADQQHDRERDLGDHQRIP